MSKDALRTTIRAQLLAGVLPFGVAKRVFGGPGEGEPCDCCGQVIERHEIEYEAEVSFADGIAGLRLVAHRVCFDLWNREAARLRAESTPTAEKKSVQNRQQSVAVPPESGIARSSGAI
jgi:hypothetical protein